jgi:hypothetical protein
MADIVETGADPAFLIVAPTMRVPMRLVDSVNPYLAARAVLRLLLHGSFIVGGIRAETCAMQVRAAIDDVLHDRFTMPQSWAEASERHQLLYTHEPVRLQ